jgi:outer membrane protein
MRLLLLLALLAAGAAHAQDLLQVYTQARSADPQRAGADALRGVQRETAEQARAALRPQWSLSASQSRAEGQGRANGITSSLSQVLLDLGRLRTARAEETQVSAEDARLRAAEQDLCARVARSYFGVLLAQAELASTQANEDAYAQQVAQAQSRFDTGLSAQVDLEQARTYHALARGSTVRARQALADAREALAQTTGQLPGTLRPLALNLPMPPLERDAQAWVDAALRDNPGLQAQALLLQADEQRIEAARAEHGPTVVAGLDTQRLGGPGTAAVDRGRTVTQVALRLNVPLFAGGAVQSQVRQAGYRRDAAREELLAVRRALVRETQARYLAVTAGVTLVESSRAAVDAAERALASTRAGQGLGTRTMTDLLLAIQTLTAAQSAHDQARHGYVLARLLLLQSAGALGEAELAQANRLLD